MPRKKMWVEWEDGSDLSSSRKKPGEYSPLTREDGTNRLGQVTLSPIDEDEADAPTDPQPVFIHITDDNAADSRAEEPVDLEALLNTLVLLAETFVALQKAMPHVKRFWNTQALPAVKSTWDRVARSRRTGRRAAAAESSPPGEAAAADSSQEVMTAPEEEETSMSGAEARQRFAAALVTRMFSDEQLRILRNARIKDDVDPTELMSVMEVLRSEQFGERVKLALESNPSLTHEEKLAELGRILGTSPVDGGHLALEKRKDRGDTASG
ncbi:hypothetical protein [Streptomyces sp. E-15]